VKHSQPQQGALIADVPPITNGGSIKVVQPAGIDEPAPPNGPRVRVRTRVAKSGTQRQELLVAANQKATRDAKAIESWQSPTATLLESPSDALLKSMPQLNQSGDELKSFLPTKPK